MENTLENKARFFRMHFGKKAILEDGNYIDFATINEWFIDNAELILWKIDLNGEIHPNWQGLSHEKLKEFNWIN